MRLHAELSLNSRILWHHSSNEICQEDLIETETTVKDAWEEVLEEVWETDRFKKR